MSRSRYSVTRIRFGAFGVIWPLNSFGLGRLSRSELRLSEQRVSETVHFQTPAIGDEISRVLAFDHRAAGDAISRLQRFPAINLCFASAASPGDFSRANSRVRCIGAAAGALDETRLGHRLFRADSQQLEADRLRARSIACAQRVGKRGRQFRFAFERV